jgi:4'-phosphopantetheinyl transferase
MMNSQLQNNQIDVWLLPIAGWNVEDLSGHTISHLLSEKEQTRFQRFKPKSKKAEFIASRILLRHLLCTYTNSNTAETEAIPDEMGRPFWFEKDTQVDLFFSLSHTKEMICCAVSREREIGCDIESSQPRKYEHDLTERVFSRKELNYYTNLP